MPATALAQRHDAEPALSPLAPPLDLDDPELLLPDLGVLPPADLWIQIDLRARQRLLRFTNVIYNIGEGPIELRGELDWGSETHRALQRVYRRDGDSIEKHIGEFTWHDAHEHWHFDRGLAVYDLWAVDPEGKLAHPATEGNKVTWCLIDTYAIAPGWGGAPVRPFYNRCQPVMQGIAVGWADVYDSSLDGQHLDITWVPDGVYAVRSIVNPDKSVAELDYTNNVNVTYVQIDGLKVSILPPP